MIASHRLPYRPTSETAKRGVRDAEAESVLDRQEQKKVLCEGIYAPIDRLHPVHKDAGNIIGMVLDMVNSDLITMQQDMYLFKYKETSSFSQSAADMN
ncbi:hypothetical protein Y032_0585g326 [Ancylostoma ceylanicum]|uniref:PABC domain-containing protein n=1 Tax=Ancylostoma ceylanicum TaxID=53326 RepID=A0A016WN37_9BILA|nr:hypothetical protein Y032_0585g326 [Ancylostoma ceylanicum]